MEHISEQVVSAIVDEKLLYQWKYFGVAFAVLIIVAAFTAYLVSYFQAKGQRAATNADLRAILSQVEQTTTITKDIELRLSRVDWTTKERVTLRRDRLERSVMLAFEIPEWLDQMANSYVFGSGDKAVNSTPLSEFDALMLLYFPDLESHRITISGLYSAHMLLLTKTRLAVIEDMGGMQQAELAGDHETYKKHSDARLATVREVMGELGGIRIEMSKQVYSYALAAAEVMQGMMEIERG